jgi:transposase
MLGFEHLAIDGQKIHANANFRQSLNEDGLKKRYKSMKNGIQKILEQEISEDFTDEMKESRLKTLRRKQKEAEDFLGKLKAVQDNIEDEKEKEKLRLNMTDPEARVMKHKDGRKLPSYNHQSAVDDKYGITVAVQTETHPDRAENVLELANQARENTGRFFENVTADSAFCSFEILEEVTGRPEEFYIPDNKLNALMRITSNLGKIARYRAKEALALG